MESAMMNAGVPAWFAPYAATRADIYVMLASLLSRAPSDEVMKILQDLQWEEPIPEKLDTALTLLRRAGGDYPAAAAQAEFNRLFVGLGCGEMVPYASWYREKKIQSLPLASLRTDLMRLGIVRQGDSHESEDHAGALCEIMALIARRGAVDSVAQAQFFRRHLDPWMMTFFHDLQSAPSADFYRVVGFFGCCFLAAENEYL